MFDFILWIISPVSLVMCLVLFKRLNVLERKLDLLDPSLGRRGEGKKPETVSDADLQRDENLSFQQFESEREVTHSAVKDRHEPEALVPEVYGVPAEPAEPVDTPVSTAFDTPVSDFASTSDDCLDDNLKTLLSRKHESYGGMAADMNHVDDGEISIEQVIGTRWIPVAGIILLILGAGFFLKFAYDNFSISPVGRVLVVAGCGVVGLAAGEITRRREYEIVAKSVTALGFGLLYAAVFASSAFYEILEVRTALTLAIGITVAAMLYAVVLDEIVIAFLSLLGGYLTPLIIANENNMPVPLFAYLLVLSVGAIQCSYYRKWRPVNAAAFAGTFALYVSWYFKYYYGKDNGQTVIALTALSIFFAVFLVMPILYDLIKKTKAGKEDVLLILANSVVTYYLLYATLYADHQMWLAIATVLMSGAHLAMMLIARIRLEEDKDLHFVLLGISLVTFTIALPLFFEGGSLSFAWAVQGAGLALIGVRYRSTIIRVFGLLALGLSCGNLLWNLPMHTGEFRLIFNPDFGIWAAVAAGAFVNHLVYRYGSKRDDDLHGIISQVLYVSMCLLLGAACLMEWYYHCNYNVDHFIFLYAKGVPVIFSGILALSYIRPVCPSGKIRERFAVFTTGFGILVALVSICQLHRGEFVMFANAEFVSAGVFAVVLGGYHFLYRFVYSDVSESEKKFAGGLYALSLLAGMFVVSVEWYFHCLYNLDNFMPSFVIGQVMIFAATLPLMLVRPVSPLDGAARVISIMLAVSASMCTVVWLVMVYNGKFTIFFNGPFIAGILFAGSLGLSAVPVFREDKDGRKFTGLGMFFCLCFVFVLWALLTEQIFMYWYCLNKYGAGTENWILKANMYISLMWAVYAAGLMVVGFWRRMAVLRYIALGLFGLLVCKIFIVDTSQLENVYRITAFVATGIVLVGVSYLYQYLKKRDFFENLASGAIMGDDEKSL